MSGLWVTGGVRHKLRRGPIHPDLTPRADNQACDGRVNHEPNARSQILFWFTAVLEPIQSILPKLQGVEVGLTYGSTGKGLCQPKPSLRIQLLHGRA